MTSRRRNPQHELIRLAKLALRVHGKPGVNPGVVTVSTQFLGVFSAPSGELKIWAPGGIAYHRQPNGRTEIRPPLVLEAIESAKKFMLLDVIAET